MPRAIDVCTCGEERRLHERQHGDMPEIMDHQFMPHPQPERVEFAKPHIQRLKYVEAGVGLIDAAKLLVVNQEPWAGRVRVTAYDYALAGLRWPDTTVAIMRPVELKPLGPPDDPMEPIGHRFIISVDDDVPTGQVWI